MTQDEIIDMWHAANGTKIKGEQYEVVEAFAKLVAKHTLMNIDPSKFMSHQEGIEAGRLVEREKAQAEIDTLYEMYRLVCNQRDELMDQQRAQVAAMRGRIQ